MSKEVKRYSPDTNGRMREWPEGDYATWDDYDELAAENDRLRTKNDRMARERSARQALSIQLIDEARGLRAERDAAQKDAERYRWMRAVVIAEREGCTEELYDNECDRLLEAYDAALQGAQP